MPEAARFILIDEAFQKNVMNELQDLKALLKDRVTPKNLADEDELMDTFDVEKYLKCCRRTVLKYRKAGMPSIKKENGRVYFWRSQIDIFLEKPESNAVQKLS